MSGDSNPIFQRAVRWLSDLQDGKADSAALFRWLAESPRHVEEFTLALTFTDEVAGLTDEQCAAIAAMNSAQGEMQTVLPLNNVGHRRDEQSSDGNDNRPRSKLLGLAAAIFLAVLLGGGLLWWNNGWHTYATDFGEQRIVELDDGSTIHLNTQSRVRVRYDAASRNIRMISGEALFKVERDSLHPFRVYAEQSVIQALGTQFNVYRRPTGTTVSVLEGSVRIAPISAAKRLNSSGDGKSSAQRIESLDIGQEATIALEGQIVTRKIDVRQAAAWRQHRLVFDDNALADIAAEFNRYNQRPKIRVEDARAAAQRFAATFDADAPESLVQVLQTNPGLTVVRSGDEIVVRSREGYGQLAP
jgi:transmembrane sensor